MTVPASDVQLRVISDNNIITSSVTSTDSDRCVKISLNNLTANTSYTYEILSAGLIHSSGKFKTHPASSGVACSFMVAFGGDAETGSVSSIFDRIRELDPLMFIHLGDRNYSNISTNSPSSIHAAYDTCERCPPQARLMCQVPWAYVWDDHDYGGNNSDGTSLSKPASASVYRQRVPHYSLPHATAIYQTWDIGRVRFIMTDQRSEASVNSTTDNSSKSMLGTTQKTWFKDLVSNSPNKLIVWICPRWFANANHTDSWNNFSTERRELVDHIKANAHGRVIVIEADQHTLGIDDGSNVDHATGGGEPLKCFRAAPLDQFVSSLGGTYSHGEFNNNGQFGTMSISDSGDTEIDVTWTGYNNNNILTTFTFSVDIT